MDINREWDGSISYYIVVGVPRKEDERERESEKYNNVRLNLLF